MIIPSQPPSSYGEDQDPTLPPPYQERGPASQLLPSERPTTSPYAPSISLRSNPPREREKELPPHPTPPGENSPIGFPEPRTPTARTNSNTFPSPFKGGEGPAQRAFEMFSSMVWGTPSTASISRSPNLASTSTPQDPLNPAPLAFTRPTPKNYAYLPFQPMTMLGISSNLADGFPLIPPPINSEDESKTNTQHPFVSHDVTEDDWLKLLADIKTVASAPNQTQKSFLARMFLGEINERDQRKRAVHFLNSWNHYFFQPRRMTVVLARGRRIFNGSGGNHHHGHHHDHHHDHHHRRHSIGHDRGRDTDPTRRGGHQNRHRSYSTDSSSSDSSTSSSSSIRSTTSEPPEMPVPHTHEPQHEGDVKKGVLNEDEPRSGAHGDYWTTYGLRSGLGGPIPGLDRGGRWGGGWNGGRGRYDPRTPGPSAAPPVPGLGGGLGCGEPRSSPTYHERKKGWDWEAWEAGKREWDAAKLAQDAQKRAWKVEKKSWKTERRGMKYERRRMKRAAKHERRQRKGEARAMRHHGEGCHKGDQPWKLIISFHGARSETAPS